MLNATPLLNKFLDEISPTTKQRTKLNGAKNDIRNRLRESFRAAGRELRDRNGKSISIVPKFRTQGSFAYETVNQPINPPVQQIDLDDGTYLPMSIMEDVPPSMLSDMFFEFVDSVLFELAKERKWRLDVSKDTCSRLILDNECHIDVPLYAIPDNEHAVLEAMMKTAGYKSMASFAAHDELYIDPSRVYLAHRKKDWISSDPRKIHTWFLTEVENYGEQLRRMCRLIKAWRDCHEDLDGLTSILIMAAVWEVYDNCREFPIRDDHALLLVTEALPSIFAADIYNPAEPSERLSERVPVGVMQRAQSLMREFHEDLSISLSGVNEKDIVTRLQDHLGARVPTLPNLVSTKDTKIEIIKHPEIIVPAAAVITSRSG